MTRDRFEHLCRFSEKFRVTMEMLSSYTNLVISSVVAKHISSSSSLEKSSTIKYGEFNPRRVIPIQKLLCERLDSLKIIVNIFVVIGADIVVDF